MTTHDILVAARAKIADPARWCQRAAARDPSGFACSPSGERAIRWCAWGAVIANGGNTREGSEAVDILMHHAFAICDVSLAEVNDSRGHAAILKVYDAAIAATAPASGEGAHS